MSLSVCLITADPAARIAAILEPLRALADEVVIAADARVDEQTLAGYGALADRLFKVEHVLTERHLAWLFAQCGGDWILRLDGDEVLSQALLRRLPELVSQRDMQQFWIARAWLYPDGAHFLAGAPWADDFVNRLLRNDGTLRVTGQQHRDPEPVVPRGYVEEVIYHCDLLTSDRQRREDKVVCNEVAHPGLVAHGGGRINEAFYLPELRDRLELQAVPEEDRVPIARALVGQHVSPAARAGDVRLVSLGEMDRMWEGRSVEEGAYRARIEARHPTEALTPGELSSIFVHVHNDGTERWPAGLEEAPEIRLGYRWLDRDGGVHTEEGPRSPFHRPVKPGESVLVALNVVAPQTPGEYVLVADVVHEHVRWFDCPCRVAVSVEHPKDLPPTGVRLRETPLPRMRRVRAVRIPRVIHRIWLGDAPIPEEHERFGATFAQHHPGWEMRLWTDDDLPTLGITATDRERSRTYAELSNLVRYEIMHRVGGVYVDTDVECRRSFTPLVRGIDAFAGLELPGRVCNAVLGAVAGHPLFARAARLARRTLGIGVHSPNANGPYFLTLLIEQEPNFAIFGKNVFYPYLWDERERREEEFADSYAVHHWALSWVPEKDR